MPLPPLCGGRCRRQRGAPVEYLAELEAAQEAARRGGDILQRYRESGARYGWKHGDPLQGRAYEIVSEADVEVDHALRDTLQGAFPDDAWLSEEAHDDRERLLHRRVWIVDPLDGTREFLQGVPEYAVSIALAFNGQPVLGVVFNPDADEMFAATMDSEDERFELDEATSLADSFMLVGRGEWHYRELPPVPDGTRVMPVGSIAYRMALLASGQGCLVFTPGRRSEWDLAAGAALLTAAGATVTDIDGRPLQFNQAEPSVKGLIAARPEIHKDARELWERSGWRIH
ncbi:MAG: 3'(2'),5'-bisphosphate nucleotidase CysQ [Chloroflexi bacterium]|nr:3'(2'),5'-bisphosphate nucleotidase CysQ [Chloroflexota bacterium]MXX80244.1 3'(2'),5'-bisphosphate nucleotidase CysQ [Chloroflexota bacterium]MYB22938.1 3'(2'),5'-bisphosphate nucleotidase CysQ [Chloroflexota bacterium]MYD15783.1 3'(2'),5'-bisphosphate nucleotidase CysQ [Chloroflexota bacterium]MYF22997.1 3'(2'),5'-bisphosphate nucleotidase CysQ [Chloroflexota bacterium]